MVEQFVYTEKVGGSNPSPPTKAKFLLRDLKSVKILTGSLLHGKILATSIEERSMISPAGMTKQISDLPARFRLVVAEIVEGLARGDPRALGVAALVLGRVVQKNGRRIPRVRVRSPVGLDIGSVQLASTGGMSVTELLLWIKTQDKSCLLGPGEFEVLWGSKDRWKVWDDLSQSSPVCLLFAGGRSSKKPFARYDPVIRKWVRGGVVLGPKTRMRFPADVFIPVFK